MARNPRSVRFPPALEEQVQEWADEHRMPFNRAVVELLGRAVAPAAVAPAIVEIDHADGTTREIPVKREPAEVTPEIRQVADKIAPADPVTKAMRALDELKPLAREVKPDPRKK